MIEVMTDLSSNIFCVPLVYKHSEKHSERNSENGMIEFCKVYKLKNLVKGAKYYKIPEKPSCIDLIPTNRPRSFHGCHIIETGLSDFHEMTVIVIKMCFKKQGLRVLRYRDYKRFNTQRFRQDVFANLHEENVTINQLEKFSNVF